jgi:hypothetical protein
MADSARQLHLFRSRRQRGVAPPPPLEFQMHCMVADTLKRWAAPNWVFTHFPAGERRDEITGARLKRMGVVPGIPDFLLFPPQHAPKPQTHFLELKRRGNKLTGAQAEFALWARLNKYPFEIADSYKAAVKILQQWGALLASVKVQ